MFSSGSIGRVAQCRWSLRTYRAKSLQTRSTHHDHRNRLSAFWTPTQRQANPLEDRKNGSDLLVRGGFLRQAHSGLFHLLPLGLRVQNKIERMIDQHMASIGACKASLSSISSEQLWQRSGRLDKSRASEFLRFEDRKGAKYLLSPTHEEEITTVVAESVSSYKDLPLRLYQVSRKYRDEPRPRQGLLRAREFVMKDLYTFDASEGAAKQTYEEVRNAYGAFFNQLKLPYLVATADSGNMGGDLSHEFHFVSEHGEDTIISCDTCDYIVNEEKFVARNSSGLAEVEDNVSVAIFLTKDRKTAIRALWPGGHDDLNSHAIKKQFPGLDTGSRLTEKIPSDVVQLITLVDPRVAEQAVARIVDQTSGTTSIGHHKRCTSEIDDRPALLTRPNKDDLCPECQKGRIRLQTAIEIGHTFHLGSRYSDPLNARVLDSNNEMVTISMGCHGIGVSRIIGAASLLLQDDKGLNWPYPIAPFGAVIIPGADCSAEDIDSIYDGLHVHNELTEVDAIVDDREKAMGWKLKDADLVGYPFIIVLGKSWKESKKVELQCRRLGVKETVSPDELGQGLRAYVHQL